MIVSVDTRLASMLSAMTGAILPVVGDNAFVTEQAQLVAGHLQVLRAQGEYSEEFEHLEHRYMRALAAELAAGAEGGPRTTDAASRLRGLLDRGEPDRAFCGPFGYEDGSVEIAPIDRMMSDFRASFPGKGASA